MIDITKAREGLHVFYQQPHMPHPEYGVIVRPNWYAINSIPSDPRALIFVRFFDAPTPKACRAQDLYWPPDYCAADECNPPRAEEMPVLGRNREDKP